MTSNIKKIFSREINIDRFSLARLAAIVIFAASAVSWSVFLIRSAARELELNGLRHADFFETHFVAKSGLGFEEVLDFKTVRRITRAHLAQLGFFLHFAFLKNIFIEQKRADVDLIIVGYSFPNTPAAFSRALGPLSRLDHAFCLAVVGDLWHFSVRRAKNALF